MTTASVTDQLARARQVAAGPRKRMAALRDRLQAAVAEGRYADAASIQIQVQDAREECVIADAAIRALEQGATAAEQARQAETRQIELARQASQARQMLAEARAAEQEHLAAADTALAAMREHLAAARRAYDTAAGHDEQTTRARARVIQARGLLGEWPPGHPGPAPARAEKAAAAATRDSLVAELARWVR